MINVGKLYNEKGKEIYFLLNKWIYVVKLF